MILTEEMLINEGYKINGKLTEAFYLLFDGTLWDGVFEYTGMRDLDHREVEAFTTLDRYDKGFWEFITKDMGLILLVPECKEIQINPKLEPSIEQARQVNELKRLGYIVREFK